MLIRLRNLQMIAYRLKSLIVPLFGFAKNFNRDAKLKPHELRRKITILIRLACLNSINNYKITVLIYLIFFFIPASSGVPFIKTHVTIK